MNLTLGSPPGFTRRILSRRSEENVVVKMLRCSPDSNPPPYPSPVCARRSYNKLTLAHKPPSNASLSLPAELLLQSVMWEFPRRTEPPDLPPDPPDPPDLPTLMVLCSSFKVLYGMHLPDSPANGPSSTASCVPRFTLPPSFAVDHRLVVSHPSDNRVFSHRFVSLRRSLFFIFSIQELLFVCSWRLHWRSMDRVMTSGLHLALSIFILIHRSSSMLPSSIVYALSFVQSSYLDKRFAICFPLSHGYPEADETGRCRQATRSESFSGCSRRSISHSLGLRLRFLHFMLQSSSGQCPISTEAILTKNFCYMMPSSPILTGESLSRLTQIFSLRDGSLSANLLVKTQFFMTHALHTSGQIAILGVIHELHKEGFFPNLSPSLAVCTDFYQTTKGSILHHKAFSTSSFALERSFPSSSFLQERTFQSFFLYWRRLVLSSSCYGEKYCNSFTVLLSCLQVATGIVLVTVPGSKDRVSKSLHNVIISIELGSTVSLISTQLSIVFSSLSLLWENLSLLISFIFKSYVCNQRGCYILSSFCTFEV